MSIVRHFKSSHLLEFFINNCQSNLEISFQGRLQLNGSIYDKMYNPDYDVVFIQEGVVNALLMKGCSSIESVSYTHLTLPTTPYV
jgi:hypothetical protein